MVVREQVGVVEGNRFAGNAREWSPRGAKIKTVFKGSHDNRVHYLKNLTYDNVDHKILIIFLSIFGLPFL